MSKRNKTMEKEGYEWRVKYEKCNRSLLDIVGDKQAQDAYVAKSARQITQLQKLCRTLQAERATFIEVLAANNIERPAMPELPPLPTDIEAPPKSADKLDIMSRNCMELKKSLAQLQTQMNTLSTEKPEPKRDVAAAAATVTKKTNKKKATKKPAKDRVAVVAPAAATTPAEVATAEVTEIQVEAAAPETETATVAICANDKLPIDTIVPEPIGEPTEEAIARVSAPAIETTSV